MASNGLWPGGAVGGAAEHGMRERPVYGSGCLYFWNESVIYVVRHHKAKRLNNREFNVPIRPSPVRTVTPPRG